MVTQNFCITLRAWLITGPRPLTQVVFRACHGPHPRFQRTHPLSGMGSSLNASQDIDLAPIVYQNQWLTQGMLQWLAQLALAHLKLRTDLSTYAVLATHDSHSSSTNDDSIASRPCLDRRVEIQDDFQIKTCHWEDLISSRTRWLGTSQLLCWPPGRRQLRAGRVTRMDPSCECHASSCPTSIGGGENLTTMQPLWYHYDYYLGPSGSQD